MKKMTKILSMAMAATIVLSALAGCGGGGNNSSQATTPSKGETSSTAATSSTASAPEGGGTSAEPLGRTGVPEVKYAAGELPEPYEETVHLTFGNNKDENSDGILAMEAAGEPLNDNRWTRYFKDSLNIECEYAFNISNTVDYNQKLLLAMSSGTLPDIFAVFDLSMLKQLYQGGSIMELSQIYKDNVNETLRDIIEYEGTDIYNAMTFDGGLWAIPIKMPSTNGYNHCWVRQDWLDELGLERPTTMQDVHDIAKAFVENKENNIGLMLSKEYIAESKGIFWAYGGKTAVRKYWQKLDDGTVGFSEVQPEMKGGLAWLRDMYSEGLVNKEFATQDIPTAFEYVGNNQCGIFFGPHWYGFRLESAEGSMDETANWVACGLPTGIEGQETKVYATNTFDGVWCVNSQCKNPEALVRLLDAHAEKLSGPNNDFENFFACEGNSSCWSASPVHVLHPMIDLEPHLAMKEAYPDNMDTLTGSAKNYWDYIQRGQSAYQYMFGPKDSCFEFVGETYPDIVEWNAYYGAPTETWADRWSSMQELIDTTYLKIIQGEVDLDSGFDQMVEEWNSIGGEQVTKEVNEIVATY